MLATSSEEEYNQLLAALMHATSHVLVRGGAGAGKTTAALSKAGFAVEAGLTHRHSKALFLSFANATIDRVAEHATAKMPASQRQFVEISTYHSFSWTIIRSHAYLVGTPRSLRILGTGELNAYLSSLPADADVEAELRRLVVDLGEAAFDQFAALANDVLSQNPILLDAYCDAYPVIFLDEFQDTSEGQWSLMKTLGSRSQLVALGDPDQRIYTFAGASPVRFDEFRAQFGPLEIDFSGFNWRSPEGSIAKFGRDVLRAQFAGDYPAVNLVLLDYPPLMRLKSEVMAGLKRLRKTTPEGTIAILTSSNALSASVYDYFRAETPPLPSLQLDIHAGKGEASAAAVFIAVVLETVDAGDAAVARVSRALATYVRTRSPKVSGTARTEAEKLDREADRLERGGQGRELKSTLDLRSLVQASLTKARTGHPFADFLATVSTAAGSTSKTLQEAARHTRLVNLMTRGSAVELNFANAWRDTGCYQDAGDLMARAVIEYQMYSAKTAGRNLVVMNIHRAKGKEFDEVFVYEERYKEFVRDSETDLSNARYAMNVAVTRARSRVTILTPRRSPSRLFREEG